MRARSVRRSGLPFVAAAAVVGLVGSVIATGQASAAPPTRTGTAKLFGHHSAPRNSISHGLPRVLQNTAAGLPAGVPNHGRYAFLLRLDASSTLSTYHQHLAQGRPAAARAAKSQLTRIKSQQADVVAALPSRTQVLYKAHSVLAGVAVVSDVRNYGALTDISGVQAVYPIAPKTVSNSYAMPLQKAPQAWQAHGDLGANSTIAIIDTGIDYTHANFGGSGDPADYTTAKANETADPTYPDPDKIVGGNDFVGNSYDPDPFLDDGITPNPDYQPVAHQDNNPLDCEGHGSHVAGIAAGYGENPDGTTYAHDPTDYTSLGSLSTSAYQDLFRIGPGFAPKAHLLAYKVFGCQGSTNVVGEAIDAAADPNGDGDPSDHATVINMSLGSDYASGQDGDSIEANLASTLGITVVAASGNAGDQYDAGGSPADASRVLAVANSVDAYNQIDTLHASVNANAEDFGAQRSAAYDWTNNSDLGGTVVKLSSANSDGCDPLSTTDAAAVNGKIAFLEWTDDDATRRCGSAARSKNVADAGASGAILGEDNETFTAGITGSDTIPVVQVVKSAADAIRAALNASQPVTVTGTSAADFTQLVPADDDKVNTSSSRGVRGAGNVKPDVSAVGTSVFSTAVGTGNEGVSFTGTSMATPMVAGLAALVQSIHHSSWTPEEVKADIMNTAGQDLFTAGSHTGTKYAPNRVGAGRIDADKALDNLVVAYVQDNPGAVSVSFGPVAVTGAMTLTKTVKVVNKAFGSAHDATFNVSYQPITSVPGVSYQVSPTTLTVPAGTSKTFTVKFVVTNPKALTKTHDATKLTPTLNLGSGLGDRPGDYLADASGRVVLAPTSGSTVPLRVPVYSAPRPASVMSQPSTVTLPGSGVQVDSFGLTGTGVTQGSGTTKVQSLVSGFELQASSGLAPACTVSRVTSCINSASERSADLKYVGTSSDYPLLQGADPTPFSDSEVYFAVTTQGAWRTPVGPQEFDVLIDTNGDNVADAIVYNTRLGTGDLFLSELLDVTDADPTQWFIRDDEFVNDRLGDVDTAIYDSDTMVLPVWLGALGTSSGFPALPGFSGSHSRIRYGVMSFGESGVVDSIGVNLAATKPTLSTGYLSTDVAHPGLELANDSIFNHALLGYLLVDDKPGTSAFVRRDLAQYDADKAKGALIVHFQNKVGSKAKVVTLKSRPTVSIKLSRTSITLHHSLSATVTVANTAGHTPTGRVTLHRPGPDPTVTLSGGKATFTWTPGSRGTFTVYATYGGDANYASGQSAKVTYKVT